MLKRLKGQRFDFVPEKERGRRFWRDNKRFYPQLVLSVRLERDPSEWTWSPKIRGLKNKVRW